MQARPAQPAAPPPGRHLHVPPLWAVPQGTVSSPGPPAEFSWDSPPRTSSHVSWQDHGPRSALGKTLDEASCPPESVLLSILRYGALRTAMRVTWEWDFTPDSLEGQEGPWAAGNTRYIDTARVWRLCVHTSGSEPTFTPSFRPQRHRGEQGCGLGREGRPTRPTETHVCPGSRAGVHWGRGGP